MKERIQAAIVFEKFTEIASTWGDRNLPKAIVSGEGKAGVQI